MNFGVDLGLVTGWLRNQGLEIALIVFGSILLHRAVAKFSRIWTEKLNSEQEEQGLLVRSEESKYRHSLIQVAAYIIIGVIYIVGVTMVVERIFNIPITALVAPATVLGAALGFGAQRIVQDFLAGFFIITEKQYGYGDIVEIDAAGSIAAGTVEDVTLRVTKVRTLDGEVVTVPNGQIIKATNQSRDWARSIVDIPVPNTVDINFATGILQTIASEIAEDSEVSDYILDEPTVMGVQHIALEQTTVRLLIRTLPGMQWTVARRVRAIVQQRFREKGIRFDPEALMALRVGMIGGRENQQQ